MPKGLLVDFGGVLTTSVFDAFSAFARAEGIDPVALGKMIRDAIAVDGNMFHRVECGQIDTDEFEPLFAEAIAEACGVTVASVGLKTRLFDEIQPDERMLAALRAARAAGIKTALLSNSWGVTRGGYPVEQFDELFDAVIISGEVRLRKPDAPIYLLAAQRVDLPPGECVFVDDLQVNVEGATAAGMIGMHHTDSTQTLRELEALFGVEFGA